MHKAPSTGTAPLASRVARKRSFFPASALCLNRRRSARIASSLLRAPKHVLRAARVFLKLRCSNAGPRSGQVLGFKSPAQAPPYRSPSRAGDWIVKL